MSTPDTDPVRRAHARIAVATREKWDPEVIAAARSEFTAAKLERSVRQALESEHPPTPERRAEIAAILSGETR